MQRSGRQMAGHRRISTGDAAGIYRHAPTTPYKDRHTCTCATSQSENNKIDSHIQGRRCVLREVCNGILGIEERQGIEMPSGALQ